MTTEAVRHRGLAVAAAAVALPAVGGAVGLANDTIDMGEAIVERFPWQSVELAGLALFACVAVPFAALAVMAWRGSRRTPLATVAAGLLLVAWIVVQVLVIRTLSLFHPTYLVIGLSFVWAGWRMVRREDQDERSMAARAAGVPGVGVEPTQPRGAELSQRVRRG